ncbi:hypothetical protein AMATHDRAFT_778 [Amanita thiersii Skay4041]|uniref:Uncharacterized protein n=1 Tax=Amanita thiersii Skay4041 TaxID=703135 RepID=A0A2A9NV54_9AGAR|nr:hypothetical protein AMATHDRAFT_778 [Amanita thiersii Skay4041]
MTANSPTSLLTDSINAFSRSALRSLKDLESQLAQAHAEAREARKERDDAVKQVHASQLETQAQKQDVLSYKASLAQAELSIAHQTDVITQLHREVNHWKEQARNWQEHFNRVEQERCALSTRLDELVTEAFQNTSTTVPITPSQLFGGLEPSLAATTKRLPTESYITSHTQHQEVVKANKSTASLSDKDPLARSGPTHKTSTTVHTPQRSNAPSKSKTEKNGEPSKKSSNTKLSRKPRKSVVHPSEKFTTQRIGEPTQLVIRRVQAVVHVKSEDEEGDIGNLPPESLSSCDEHEGPPSKTRRNRNISRKTTQKTVQDDDEVKRKTTVFSGSAADEDSFAESDGDDELMLVGDVTNEGKKLWPISVSPNKKRRLNSTKSSKS